MDKLFNIAECGAVADGRTKNTDAIAMAVGACEQAGGGTVLVPAGRWLTGPIRFVSNMRLHVEVGATVLFSTDFADYPMVRLRRMGVDSFGRCPPMYAKDCRNISIIGRGEFDGQGQAWRFVKKWKLTDQEWEDLVGSGGHVVELNNEMTWWPTEKAFAGKAVYDALVKRIMRGEQPEVGDFAGAGDYLRPPLLQFYECRNVLLEGPIFSNSPFWNTHLVYCDDVIVHGCTFKNPWNAQNGDGLDIDSCRNVEVSGCKLSTGDDAICVKSGRDADGWRAGRPSENIHISDCDIQQGHGGVAIGSEMSGDVRDVTVVNCRFEGCGCGINCKSARGRGGVVENVRVENCTMANLKGDAINFGMLYKIADPALDSATDRPPLFRNFHIRNVRCDGAGGAITILGLPESPIESVTLEGLELRARQGIRMAHARNIRLADVAVEVTGDDVGVKCEDVEGLDDAGLTICGRQ